MTKISTKMHFAFWIAVAILALVLIDINKKTMAAESQQLHPYLDGLGLQQSPENKCQGKKPKNAICVRVKIPKNADSFWFKIEVIHSEKTKTPLGTI